MNAFPRSKGNHRLCGPSNQSNLAICPPSSPFFLSLVSLCFPTEAPSFPSSINRPHQSNSLLNSSFHCVRSPFTLLKIKHPPHPFQFQSGTMCQTSYTGPLANPCKHLADFKLKFGSEPYTHLRHLLKPTPSGRTIVRSSKSPIPRCDFCSAYRGRLYSCLVCSAISCRSSDLDHAHLHPNTHAGHDIAVDIDRSELYCCVCRDQVYDPEFDRVVVSKVFEKMPKRNLGRLRKESKRRRVGFGCDLIGPQQVGMRRDLRSKTVYPLGLRGLNNLGNTCFMNSVLQALLHAPPLRNYFLGDRHNREFCRKRSLEKLCFPCDVDSVFSAVFSGDRTPYSPAQFLYSWWLHLENLANYEQQDAHEFFISMLDQIHEKEAKPGKDAQDCDCIAHTVFCGLLQSDVSCTACGSTSTTHDPCVDISLDLDIQIHSPSSDTSESAKSNAGSSISTLSSCLDRFTRPEKLGPSQKLYCEYCEEKQESLKQMSIKRLPLVLCLHIKRFEHSHVKRMSRKIDQYLQFPFSLDMNRYLSSTVSRTRYGNRVVALEDDENGKPTEFEIFAVVSHSGTLEAGHYVTYLRLSSQWYKCDDAWIMEVDEGTVRASQCYMIYYAQKTFYHKTGKDVGSISQAQRRGALLPIAGCC